MGKMSFDEANKKNRQVLNKKGIFLLIGCGLIIIIALTIGISGIKSLFKKKKSESVLIQKQEELAKRTPPPVTVNHTNPLKKDADVDYKNRSFIFIDSNGNRVRYGADDQMYYVDEKGTKISDVDPNDMQSLYDSTKIIAQTNEEVEKILKEKDENKTKGINQNGENEVKAKTDEEYLREQVEALGYDWNEFLGKLAIVGSNIDSVMALLDMRGHDKLEDIIKSIYSKVNAQPEETPNSNVARVETFELTSGTSLVDNAADPTPSWLRDGMTAADESMTAALNTLNNIAASASASGGTQWTNVNNPNEKSSWIEQQQSAGQSGYAGQLTQWDLAPGTIIPIILYTGLKTDQPGEIIGTVKGNVYDTLTGKNILIPRGSTVQATYNNSVTFGQKSVQIAWNLLITPDGRVYNLPGLNGIDNDGYTGVKGNVNNHFWSILGGAALGSIIQFNSAYVENYINRVAGNTYQAQLVKAASDSLNETASDFALRYAELWASLGPTITIKKAADINVMVNRIINFDPKLTRSISTNRF